MDPQETNMTTETKWSQADGPFTPPSRTWDDLEQSCRNTFFGGHHDERDIRIYRHGMATVFNLLRAEFPTMAECKAAPDLLAACEALVDAWSDQFGYHAPGSGECDAGAEPGGGGSCPYCDAQAAIAKARSTPR